VTVVPSLPDRLRKNIRIGLPRVGIASSQSSLRALCPFYALSVSKAIQIQREIGSTTKSGVFVLLYLVGWRVMECVTNSPHNPKVASSNLAPATKTTNKTKQLRGAVQSGPFAFALIVTVLWRFASHSGIPWLSRGPRRADKCQFLEFSSYDS
jgi:hypothetical protein